MTPLRRQRRDRQVALVRRLGADLGSVAPRSTLMAHSGVVQPPGTSARGIHKCTMRCSVLCSSQLCRQRSLRARPECAAQPIMSPAAARASVCAARPTRECLEPGSRFPRRFGLCVNVTVACRPSPLHRGASQHLSRLPLTHSLYRDEFFTGADYAHIAPPNTGHVRPSKQEVKSQVCQKRTWACLCKGQQAPGGPAVLSVQPQRYHPSAQVNATPCTMSVRPAAGSALRALPKSPRDAAKAAATRHPCPTRVAAQPVCVCVTTCGCDKMHG
eukprot:362024-Chlamydomonas_euryale.AAC.2